MWALRRFRANREATGKDADEVHKIGLDFHQSNTHIRDQSREQWAQGKKRYTYPQRPGEDGNVFDRQFSHSFALVLVHVTQAAYFDVFIYLEPISRSESVRGVGCSEETEQREEKQEREAAAWGLRLSPGLVCPLLFQDYASVLQQQPHQPATDC